MKVRVNVAYEDNLPGDVIDEGGETKLLDLLNRKAVTKLHESVPLKKVARPVVKDAAEPQPVAEKYLKQTEGK